jgi:hypothetical protein
MEFVNKMRRYKAPIDEPSTHLVSPVTSPSATSQSLADFIRSAKTDPPDLFEGLVARGSSVWGGQARSFKTMAALAAMLSVASGQDFLGRTPSRTGDVVYVAEEGGKQKTAERFEIMLKSYDPKHELRILHRMGITFQSERWDLVRRELVGLRQPCLVVLDTYARLNELDENGSSAAHAALTCMSGLTADFGVDVILIHHVGIQGDHLRGHSSLKAGVEGTVMFKRKGMTNHVQLEAETKDTEPETLSLCWDPETFLLGERGSKSDEPVEAFVKAVSDLGGEYKVVQVGELSTYMKKTRQRVQQLGKIAREAGQVLYVDNGPKSGYRLPASDEAISGSTVGSN